MGGVQKKPLHNYQAVTKFPEPVEKWRDFHFIVESVISVQILGGSGWHQEVPRWNWWYVCHTVGGHLCPANFKGNITFLLICQMEKSSHLYPTTLFLASLSILWSFHHLRRILRQLWDDDGHTHVFICHFFSERPQHLRLQTEWNNRLTNQQSGHILRLWWRLSMMAGLLSRFWRLATFHPIW